MNTATLNKNKSIPTQKPFTYGSQKFNFINYGEKGDDIFIIELTGKGKSVNIQYKGVSCSQAVVQGSVFKTFQSKSKWFNSTWWYRYTVWANNPNKIFFKTEKFPVKFDWTSQKDWDKVYKYAEEHGRPVDKILKTILREVKNKTGIKFELNFTDLEYGKMWAEAFVPLKYKEKNYLLTWANCD